MVGEEKDERRGEREKGSVGEAAEAKQSMVVKVSEACWFEWPLIVTGYANHQRQTLPKRRLAASQLFPAKDVQGSESR